MNSIGTTGEGSRLLVLVHGYGADEYDLGGLVPHIDPAGSFFTICPRGPIPVMDFGAGWYERREDGTIDAAVFSASVDALDATIDDACTANGLERGDAVIIGFSQGGATTLASALRKGGATRPAAIACLSGMLSEAEGLEYAFDSEPSDSFPEILIHHGTNDGVVSIDLGRATHDRLIAAGVAHTYREYPMQHEISPASIHDLREWLLTLPR